MRLLRLLAALALLTGSLAMSAPVAAGDPCYHGFDLPARSEGDEPEVKMMPCAFSPTVVRVVPGTTVTWFNDQVPHLVTGANQEWGSRDDEIGPRAKVAYRFDRPGTYPYACAIHRGMSGTIVVGDGVAPASAAGAGPAVVPVKGSGPAPARSAAPAAAAPAGSAQPAAAAEAVATEPAAATTPASNLGLLAGGAVAILAVGLLALSAYRSRRRLSETVATR
jgi:plastocyanin